MVKSGYKQTEIGVIPEDWDVVALLDKAELINGLTYTPENIQDYGLLVMRSSNVQKGKFSFEDNVYVNCAVSKERLIKRNDILICVRNGSAALIGKCAKADKDYNATFGAFMAVLRGIDNDYIFQVLLQGSVQINIVKNSDSTINQITNNDFKQVKIPYPHEKSERIHITVALSDVDKLILNLEKLIDKKKAIMQGAKSELLTGKSRLQGFGDEWISMKVEDFVVRFATGLNPRQNFKLNTGGTNYYVTIKDFKDGVLYLNETCDRIDDVALKEINERSDLRKNDLLFSSIGRIGDGYLITETPTNWNINESVFSLRPNLKIIDPQMLYWILTSEPVKRKLAENTTGSTLKSIKLGHLKKIYCTFPKDIDEQKVIAGILNEMDAEIKKLQKSLCKYRLLKQCMMSELLTGRIRLIDKEET